MRSIWIRSAVAAFVAGALVCAVPVSAKEGGKKDQEADAMFKRKDTNGDRKVTLEEYKAGLDEERGHKAGKKFAKLDKNGDGSLSIDEFRAGWLSDEERKERKEDRKGK